VLKVLHVIAHFDPGGSELQLAGVIRAAHGIHWDATLCVLNPGYPLANQLHDEGVPLVELEQRRRRDIGRVLRLRSLVRRGGFDVVHSTLWRGSMLARLAAAYPGRPAVVVSERSAEMSRPLRDRLVDRGLRPLTDHYVANSEAVAAFISRTHGVPRDRITVVRNAVDTSVFRPGPPRLRGDGVFRIGTVGHLRREKGHDLLVAALPKVLERVPAELDIVGTGEEQERLRVAAEGLPVRFRGVIGDAAKVADFLQTLDVFVMPSRFEGLPNAVLEARACGIPVVATDVPGMAEAMAPGAPLVPPEDPDELANAIVLALERPRVEDPPVLNSFDAVAVQHLDVFQRAVAARRRRDR